MFGGPGSSCTLYILKGPALAGPLISTFKRERPVAAPFNFNFRGARSGEPRIQLYVILKGPALAGTLFFSEATGPSKFNFRGVRSGGPGIQLYVILKGPALAGSLIFTFKRGARCGPSNFNFRPGGPPYFYFQKRGPLRAPSNSIFGGPALVRPSSAYTKGARSGGPL